MKALLSSLLSKYFKFDDVEPVLSDLHQMKPKVLSPFELDILEGKSAFQDERTKPGNLLAAYPIDFWSYPGIKEWVPRVPKGKVL